MKKEETIVECIFCQEKDIASKQKTTLIVRTQGAKR